jgi:glycosyltransferase involved in cell wall biosynthesis
MTARPGGDGQQWPPVTVILPTRNRPELVRESISAVVGQTYPGPIECLVVHDQEDPDHELTKLGRQHRDVAVTTNACTPGLAGSRNHGVQNTMGEFVASCDDDDVWHDTKLARQMTRMLAEPDLLVIGAGIRLLMPSGKVVDWPGDRPVVTNQDLVRSRRKELHSSTLVMRRRAFDLAGGYDEKLPNSYAEDYEWLLRVSEHGRIGVVTEPLADIRKGGHSFYAGRASVTADALEYLLRRHPELRGSRRGYARVLGQIAFARATLGQRAQARQWAVRALRVYPLAPHAAVAAMYSCLALDPKWAMKGARVVGRGIS